MHGTDVDQLIKHADLALYKSKSEGRNAYCFFDDSMGVEADSRRTLQSDLRNALANNEFELHYQPIVDIGSRGIESIEALLRWRHPRSGVMAPVLQVARTQPIVFINVADPVGAGFVETLARPGGNVTGFAQFEYSLSGKWPELLKEVAPHGCSGRASVYRTGSGSVAGRGRNPQCRRLGHRLITPLKLCRL